MSSFSRAGKINQKLRSRLKKTHGSVGGNPKAVTCKTPSWKVPSAKTSEDSVKIPLWNSAFDKSMGIAPVGSSFFRFMIAISNEG